MYREGFQRLCIRSLSKYCWAAAWVRYFYFLVYSTWHYSVFLKNYRHGTLPKISLKKPTIILQLLQHGFTFNSCISWVLLSLKFFNSFSSQHRALYFKSLEPPEITPDFKNNVPSRATVWKIKNTLPWGNVHKEDKLEHNEAIFTAENCRGEIPRHI